MEAKIYKINIGDEIYIGSTTERLLCNRQSKHNYNLRKKPHIQKLYQKCIDAGIEKIKCIWVADVKCNSIDELRKIEQDYINKYNPTLNMLKAYRTNEELKQEANDNQNRYYKENPNYKEIKKKISYTHYHKNKNEINERKQQKVICEICGLESSRNNLSTHKKSKFCKSHI